MKKILLSIIALLLTLSIAFFAAPISADAAASSPTPTANGDLIMLDSVYDPASPPELQTNWGTCISDDDDTSYVFTDQNYWSFDLYQMSDVVNPKGTINSITVCIRARATVTPDQTNVKTFLKINGNNEYGTKLTSTTTYADYSSTYSTVPGTSRAWTWDDVNTLQAGVGLEKPVADDATPAESRCTRVWIEIDATGTNNTVTSVTSSLNPSLWGQAVTFTAEVSAANPAAGTPEGTVQFKVDNTDFGSPVNLVGGTATSSVISTLSAGNHTVQAIFTGSPFFNDSTGTLAGGQIVNKRTLTVNAKTDNKVYDGTTAAGVTLSDNRLVGDDLAVVYNSANFEYKSVGKWNVNVTGISLNGTDAGNYTLSSTSVASSASITPKELTVIGVTASDKVYDGTTSAALITNNISLVGVISPDVVNLITSGISASFVDPDAGNNKSVTVSGMAVDNANYSLAQPTGLIAKISPATPIINVTGGSFNYDGIAHPATASARGIGGVDISGSGNFTFKYNSNSAAPVNTGAYTVEAAFTSANPNYSNATGSGSINIQPSLPGGSGGGGPAVSSSTSTPVTLPQSNYLTVNFLGNIFRKEISKDGALLEKLVAYSPDGSNHMVIPQSSITLDKDGQIVKFIQVTGTNMPPLTESQVGVSPAYSFEPTGVTFSQPITITLGYGLNQVTQKITSISLAYYTLSKGWVDLDSEGTIASAGEASGSVNHFTPFAVIARKAPANFQLSNLSVLPSKTKVWGTIPFVVITGENATTTADVINNGGMSGTYQCFLKLNGQTVSQQDVTLGPSQSHHLSFSLSGLNPGHYTLEVGNLSNEFTVSRVFNFAEIIGFILLLAAVIWAIVLWIKRRLANPG
jgi:hypothetical protein